MDAVAAKRWTADCRHHPFTRVAHCSEEPQGRGVVDTASGWHLGGVVVVVASYDSRLSGASGGRTEPPDLGWCLPVFCLLLVPGLFWQFTRDWSPTLSRPITL